MLPMTAAETGIAAAPAGRLSPRALSAVLAYVEAHLCGAIRLEEVAAVACMSRFHFSRRFTRATGERLMEYVARRRVERAQQRLRADPAVRLSCLAADLGFYDQAHFTHAFRKFAGCSPRGYSVSIAR